MATKGSCECGEKHQGHICVLRSRGLTREIEQISSNPTVSCFTCGAEANSAENVCSPMPLE